MLSMAFLAFVSVVLSIIPVVSQSRVNSDVKNTHWTYGAGGDVEVYVGLEKVVYVAKGDEKSFTWDSDECHNVESGEEDICNECRTATQSSIATTIINLLTALPTFSTDMKRTTRKGDMNCQKFMAMFTGIVGSISTLIALSSYVEGCFRNLPSTVAGEDVDYKLGPGFICLLVPTFLKPLDVVVNLLMPVKKDNDESDKLDEVLNGI